MNAMDGPKQLWRGWMKVWNWRLRRGMRSTLAEALIRSILEGIRQRGGAVAHLKFWVRSGGVERKISFPFLEEPGWEKELPEGSAGRVAMLVNARVEIAAEELRQVLREALAHCGAVYREIDVSFFRPAQPSPMHKS